MCVCVCVRERVFVCLEIEMSVTYLKAGIICGD